MKQSLNTLYPLSKFPAYLIIFVSLFFAIACRNKSKTDYPIKPVSYEVLLKNRNYDTNQVVIWLKSGISRDSLKRWLSQHGASMTLDTSFCSVCDSTLLLLKGNNILSLIQTARGGSQSSAQTKPSGDDGPFYYSANFPMDFNDRPNRDQQQVKAEEPLQQKSPGGKAIVVAVFDTGVKKDSIDSRFFYQSSKTSCLGPDANNGYNFANGNKNWDDDYGSLHGTVVTKFIVDQVTQYGLNNVSILPVKTHSASGEGKLFDILCGFAYAKERGANIINASFGYYAPRMYMDEAGKVVPDSSGWLLENYIETYLTKNNILLVAAAGNEDQSGYEASIFPTSNLAALRNLDYICFYPASLSTKLGNVIAVTTVHNGLVSVNQNFSPKVVNIGVSSDIEMGSTFYFYNPFVHIRTVTGSSFAAPIVTGKICANYDRIQSHIGSGIHTADKIFNELMNSPAVVSKDNTLTGKIRNQTLTKKRL